MKKRFSKESLKLPEHFGKMFVTEGSIMIIAAIIRAISVYSFVIPNQFAPGGVTGISSILFYSLGWNVPLTIFLFNIPLLFVAFWYKNFGFAVKTTLEIIFVSIFMEILAQIGFPTYGGAGADKLLAALIGGGLYGTALALVLRINASTGGSDIIGAVIQQKFTATNVSWYILAVDSIVIFIGGIVLKDFVPVMYSFVLLFVGSKASEAILNGFSTAITFHIVTSKPDEMKDKIIEKLHRGVTMLKGIGGYTNEERLMLICVVRKRQLSSFNKILKEVDPHAFVFSMSTKEVTGKGWTEKL